ncbi:MAG: asparagine synthetase B, partial [Spirochaetaceae bacterium]
MCGICGIHHFKNSQPVEEPVIRRMTESIRHRGPDDEGYYFGESIGFGFRRLSIIDLVSGHQPMSDAAGKIWVVFNGEIYNFPELRRELAQQGCEFRTNSDTEVIIHGYRKWGMDVLDHLSGMFGLAIWDVKDRRLMLARDRMGIKPIYYYLSQDTLVFGSEIRAVLAGGAVYAGMDICSAALFLQFRYVPSPRTIFRDINKLASGTRLVVEKGVARCEQWWNFAPR